MRKLTKRLLSVLTALTFASTCAASMTPASAVSGEPATVTLVPKNVVNFKVVDEDGNEIKFADVTLSDSEGNVLGERSTGSYSSF